MYARERPLPLCGYSLVYISTLYGNIQKYMYCVRALETSYGDPIAMFFTRMRRKKGRGLQRDVVYLG
jgi:hypothetical protein